MESIKELRQAVANLIVSERMLAEAQQELARASCILSLHNRPSPFVIDIDGVLYAINKRDSNTHSEWFSVLLGKS